jgi:hypothetical protein
MKFALGEELVAWLVVVKWAFASQVVDELEE